MQPAGEVLSGVILRKRLAVLPAFKGGVATGESDCLAATDIDKGACLSAEEYRGEVQSYIRLIGAGSPCYIER